ncbi:MAG: histidinol-phosphate transaminase [Prochlorotrichaceae cyanobacterium]
MLPFLRPDLAQTTGYTANPGHGEEPTHPLDALDTNESPFDLPPSVKAQLAIAYQEQIHTNRYPDGSHHRLKQALLTYVEESRQYPHPHLSRQTEPFGLEHLSIGNGSDELIRSLLIATCLPQRGSVLVADPTFSMYKILAESLGIPVVSVQRDAHFAVDCAAAQAAIDRPPAGYPPVRLVFMVHPNSPTGNGLNAAEVEWLRSLPEEILVVIDEAYFEFSRNTLLEAVLQRSNWVITRTFSKAFRLAAHRVGYAVGHPELIAVLEKLRLPYNLPTFAQAAAIAALEQRTFILEGVTELIGEREKLAQQLQTLPGAKVYPSVGNFLFLRLQPEYYPALVTNPTQLYPTVLDRLRQMGTLIRHTGGGLRVTIGDAAMNQRTRERLQAVLQSLVTG